METILTHFIAVNMRVAWDTFAEVRAWENKSENTNQETPMTLSPFQTRANNASLQILMAILMALF